MGSLPYQWLTYHETSDGPGYFLSSNCMYAGFDQLSFLELALVELQ